MNWPTWTSPDGRVRLINADCLAVRDSLPEVDAVIADPPYGMNWNPDTSRFTAERHSTVNGKRTPGRNDSKYVHGDAVPFDPSPWLNYRNVVLWGSNHFAARLPVGTLLVWIKKLDSSFETFLSDAEVAWEKGGYGVYCRRDMSMNSEAKRRVHPTQKPVGIMQWCVERNSVPDAMILDPYAGSCTTAIACVRSNRRCLCIEQDPAYFAIGKKRLEWEYQRTALFNAQEAIA